MREQDVIARFELNEFGTRDAGRQQAAFRQRHGFVLPGVQDRDYQYIRDAYATIGYPQYADFVARHAPVRRGRAAVRGSRRW